MLEIWYFLSIYESIYDILRNEKDDISDLQKKNGKMVFFSMEYDVYWLRESFCFEFFVNRKSVFFVPKSRWKYDYWNVLVLNFSGMENTVFFCQKVDWNIFTGYEKFLLWSFWECKNTILFEPKSWWKDDIHWSLKSPCFDLFGNLKIWSFFSQKGDGKMIFIWSFLVFHDIPGLGKYSFSCGLQL